MCKNLRQVRLRECTCTYKYKCTSTNVFVSNSYKLCFVINKDHVLDIYEKQCTIQPLELCKK